LPPLTSNPEDEVLLRADALFGAEQSKDLRAVVAEKIEELQHYDVRGMENVVAIVSWGRSGSLLLSSYLDGHEDVLTLPELCGSLLYQFFDRYPSLPWRDKLLAYPAYDPIYVRFFVGDFAISPERYYAAVQAIVEVYGKWPAEFLESRRAFFLFVHLAYNLALGRRPASSHPFIVHAHHHRDDVIARHFVEDFPQAKFVHTVRDPISSCDGIFHYNLASVDAEALLPFWAFFLLINRDRPHLGMESRTWTVRFEDLHSDRAGTLRDLADWLGLPFQTTLFDSTFNGIPYVVTRDGKGWSGPRLEQTKRRSPNLSRKDRALLFAVFYENFVEWNYPCPRSFGSPIVRCIVFISLFLVPFKMEFLGARAVFKNVTLPAVRDGNIWRAIRSLLGIAYCRLKIIRLLVPAFFRRRAYGVKLLQVARPPELHDQAASAAKSQMKLT
jgi:hypothetical protein